MRMKIGVLVVKDETGELRPQASIWKDNEAGKISAEIYINKNKDCEIVRASLIEK